MCAVYSESTEYDGKIKMAESLARSAGYSIGCIGIVDCSSRRLVDAWIGYGDPDTTLTEAAALESISRGLMTSFSLSEASSGLHAGNGRVSGEEASSPTWIRSNQYLIGIGERIGKVAAIVAFVSSSDGQAVTAERQSLAQVGLTYADQLLHERFAPSEQAEKPRLPEIILRSLSFGFAVTDAQGALGYMTESSRALLEDSLELHILNGRMMAKTPQNQALLQSALSVAISGSGEASVVQLEGVEGPLKTIVVMPINEEPRLALIVFGQEDADDNDLRDMLLETLGLTVAERRLARQLLSGKTLAVAAEESNLTISTARSYLKTIFAKTGIHRQSQLITLYHTLLPPVRTNGRSTSRSRRL